MKRKIVPVFSEFSRVLSTLNSCPTQFEIEVLYVNWLFSTCKSLTETAAIAGLSRNTVGMLTGRHAGKVKQQKSSDAGPVDEPLS